MSDIENGPLNFEAKMPIKDITSFNIPFIVDSDYESDETNEEEDSSE